ncbi:LysM and putative peptidoglycan-binding domain-containing protein 4 [Trichoplax sp. H2]|uniref:LysM domain-containing protein n=1 Tax=Trichoplax adhaerens TaxID=10228 RepID=B3RSC9_TRIAD|nr:hypothetical protein TRIADDRAFT_54554 [Trichoplax adhaerens]EDV26493.1 hypothetical protein TRIADDRAFT_54554 [Trichoplax adhaerens]RDD46339.1 LysM and putative peptidoglycan-binding domain-containing protein 4 [Trichoplax sp. H2]|eukprot:XP_002110489.1 hypothetical protein TRIADDRAFT_54554 [Trichoplax adhaerens]
MGESDNTDEKSRLITDGSGQRKAARSSKTQFVRSKRRTYLFGDRGATDASIGGDDESEASELRTRFGKSPDDDDNIKVIQRQIRPEDSLRSFALQYGCTVADLKKINNLYTDAGFYALKTIKIPIKKYGVLAEAEEETQLKLNRSAGTEAEPGTSETDDIEGDLANPDEKAEKFFKEKDIEVEKLKEATQNTIKKMDDDDPEAPLMLGNTPKKEDKKSLGADCGLSWVGVLVVVVIIGIVAPVLYYLYYTYFNNSNQNEPVESPTPSSPY